MQVWAENNYNTRVLHSNLAFPLLKKLTEARDPVAKQVFKDEIAKRIDSRSFPVIESLSENGYLKYLNEEELNSLTDEWVEYNGKMILIFSNILKLSERGIKDLSEIKGLHKIKSLQTLDLRYNQLTTLPKSITMLTSLKYLNLGIKSVIEQILTIYFKILILG